MRYLLFLLPALLAAQDWNQWRGPERDGVLRGFSTPAAWPKTLAKKWTAPVGEGYSSPVIAGNAVFVFTRDGAQEALTRLDLATGQVAWRKSYAAPFNKNQYAAKMAAGPFSTPLAAGGRVFTLGVMGVLTAWDAATGNVAWRKDFSKGISTAKLFTGSSMSPVLEGGKLIVHAGDDSGANLIAFDPASGAEKWNVRTEEGPGYASPVAVNAAGGRQLVTLTDRTAIGFDPATGQRLWTLPFKDEWLENIVTPVVAGDVVVLSGVRTPTRAWKITRQGPEKLWENAAVSMYMNTPVAADGYLYGLSAKKKGQFVCLDLKTGQAAWTTEGRDANQAAIVAAGRELLIQTEAGDLLVVKRSPAKFELVSRYATGESATYAHPAFAGKRMLVKDERSLALWELP